MIPGIHLNQEHLMYKLINRLRKSMRGDRLNLLAKISSADDILRELDFQNLTKNFVKIKSRKFQSFNINHFHTNPIIQFSVFY